MAHLFFFDTLKQTSLWSVLPSIRQQANNTGEEHKEAYTSEGKSYPERQTAGYTKSYNRETLTSNIISVKHREGDSSFGLTHLKLVLLTFKCKNMNLSR